MKSTRLLAGMAFAVAVIAGGQVPVHASVVPAVRTSVVAAASTASRLPPFVIYRSRRYSAAQYQGHATNVLPGMVIRLYAKRFPYTGAWHKIGHRKFRTAGTGRFRFRIAPILATRYQVRLFLDASSVFAVAQSRVSTLYVLAGYRFLFHKRCRSRPVCRLVIGVHELVPPSALKLEMAKQVVTYFGRTLAKHGRPRPVVWLYRGGGHPVVTGPRKASPGRLDMTLAFSFRVGRDAFSWNVDFCTRNTEPRDGLNLPGHHGCGTRRISRKTRYLG